MADDFPYIFTLTDLTGKRADTSRRVIVQTFDVAWRNVIVAAVAFLPGLIVAFILWGFLGQTAILSIFIVEGAAFWLVEGRQRKGLHLRNYQTFIDQKKSRLGGFYMCGRPINPIFERPVKILTNTVATEKDEELVSLDTRIDEALGVYPKAAA